MGSMMKLSKYGADKESLIPSKPPALPTSGLSETIHAETYIYDQFTKLDADLWSFEEFVKNNAWKWYGGEQEDNDNGLGTEVGRRRAELEGEAALAKFLEDSARAAAATVK